MKTDVGPVIPKMRERAQQLPHQVCSSPFPSNPALQIFVILLDFV
jgi:hypothetical protein